MGRRKDETVGSFLDSFIEDVSHLTDDYDYQQNVVRKCHCGYRGELQHMPEGWECPNCGYLLVQK